MKYWEKERCLSIRRNGRPMLGLALGALLLAACAGPAPRPATPLAGVTPGQPGASPNATAGASRQVRGMILEVVARDLTEVALLRLRDSQGREWAFTTQGPVGFTPSHLKEHQVFGQPVVVTYLEQPGRLVALAIED
jgi:hypothetical protein